MSDHVTCWYLNMHTTVPEFIFKGYMYILSRLQILSLFPPFPAIYLETREGGEDIIEKICLKRLPKIHHKAA